MLAESGHRSEVKDHLWFMRHFWSKSRLNCSFQSINRYKPIQFWEQLHHPKPPRWEPAPLGSNLYTALQPWKIYIGGFTMPTCMVSYFCMLLLTSFFPARALSLSLSGRISSIGVGVLMSSRCQRGTTPRQPCCPCYRAWAAELAMSLSKCIGCAVADSNKDD